MNGAKGCGSGAASLARPGCGFGKAAAFPKRGREVDPPAALPTESLTPLGRGCEIIELKQSPKRCLTQTSQTPFSVVL